MADFTAIDARNDGYNREFIGMGHWSTDEHGWHKVWSDARTALLAAAQRGDTLVAHGAETQCNLLFLARGEPFEAEYINERWVGGKWYHTPRSSPCQVWDSFRLSGGLSIAELAESVHVALYPTPQELGRRIKHVTPRKCFEHQRRNCEECAYETSRYEWTCTEHQRGECIQCWQTQTVQVIHTYMSYYTEWLGQYGVEPKRTLGSAASALWRKLDQPKPIWLRDRRTDTHARQGYYGGRVEPFKVGRFRDVHYADVHMMYPAVMAYAPMPDPKTTETISSRHLDATWLQYEGVMDATVYIPQMYVSPLPVRLNEELVYPVGRIRGTFTHVELRAAVQRGCTIEQVHQVTYATSTMSPFAGFAAGLMIEREKLRAQKSPLELVAKMVQNQLYGRIGLRHEQSVYTVIPLPANMSDTDFPYYEIKIKRDSILLRKHYDRHINDRWANPLWAATITGYARVRLLECMESQGANLIYSDTDSVISMAPIVGLGVGPGQLEDRGHYDDAWIIGPKLYHLSGTDDNDKVVAAGVPKHVALRFLKQREAKWQQPLGLLESWELPHYPGQVQVISAERRLTLTKRYVLNSAAIESGDSYSDTLPLTFGDTIGNEDWSMYRQAVGWSDSEE